MDCCVLSLIEGRVGDDIQQLTTKFSINIFVFSQITNHLPKALQVSFDYNNRQ